MAKRQVVNWKESSLTGALVALHDSWINKVGPEELEADFPAAGWIPIEGANEERTDESPLVI
jgi:hypothetical protein